jgi:DNA-binding HxlR family transcriptional regulator
MFIGFHFPAVARHSKTYHLFSFYRQITYFAPEDLALICNSDYLAPDVKGWEHKDQNQAYYDYVVPTAARVREYEIHLIAPEIFGEIDTDGGRVAALKHLLTERFEPLESQLSAIIAEIMQRRKVEAILAWGNTPSVKQVAARYGLPVIHNEVGALRHPHYISTAYVDFSGVNANTECERRYAAFRRESADRCIPALTREALLQAVRSTPPLPQENSQATFAVGVAKQVTLDSNIIAYAEGWDAQKLIAHAIDRFGAENILERKHPQEPGDDRGNAKLAQDTSATSVEFLAKCEQVLTINSSVGFEAMLHGKRATILGENPFRFIARMPPDAELDRRTALYFATFGYHAPYKMIYSADYLRWRLSHPSETEIVQYHLGYWLTEKSRRLVESLVEHARVAINERQWQEKQRQVESQQAQLESASQHWKAAYQALESQQSQLKTAYQALESQQSQLESAHQHWMATYQAIVNSRSWRVTAPGRRLGERLRRLKQWASSYWNRNRKVAAPTSAKTGSRCHN